MGAPRLDLGLWTLAIMCVKPATPHPQLLGQQENHLLVIRHGHSNLTKNIQMWTTGISSHRITAKIMGTMIAMKAVAVTGPMKALLLRVFLIVVVPPLGNIYHLVQT